MFSINDGWGSTGAQDVLVSKLFSKETVDQESKKKRKGENDNDIIVKTDENVKRKKKKRKTEHNNAKDNMLSLEDNLADTEHPPTKSKKKKTNEPNGNDEVEVSHEKKLKKKKKIRKEKIALAKQQQNNVQTEDSTEKDSVKQEDSVKKEASVKKENLIENKQEKDQKVEISHEKKLKKKKKIRKEKLSQITEQQNNSNKEDSKVNVNNIEDNKDTNVDDSDNVGMIKPQDDRLSKKISSFQKKMNRKLEGGHFRYINEKLYTKESSVAVDMFRREPSLFDVYHKGFESQVEHWPKNPVDSIIQYIKEQSSDLVVVDFGCGNAKLGRSVPNKVHSFDLVAVNKDVTVADMKNVPVETGSADIAVFSLSLMGTNVNDFIKEANRILKTGGKLKIAEVKSRFSNISKFIDGVVSHGFDLLNKDESNKMFVMFEFEKESESSDQPTSLIQLKPCIYKRR